MTVYLVGAGPGAPGLLTVRGRELLGRCDALVYDRLADPRIVALAPASAKRVYAGKAPDRHALSQDQINALLVELAGRHSCVVRLKGGDPFVFGRGGEEAQVLAEAGIDWEVVPGISSAYAVPAYAGIPVTQRGVAAQFTVVTGHEDPTKPESDLNWASLASAPGTLVFLMGVRALPANAARLIEQGMPGDTPAAVISHGTRPGQRTVVAPLSEIAEAAATAGRARAVLPDALRARGAAVDVLYLYRTLREPVDRDAVVASDLVTFTSSSTVENVLGALAPSDLAAIRAVSIGPVTTGS